MPPLAPQSKAIQLDLDSADLAEVYERECHRHQFPLGKRMLAQLGLFPGERLLDLGSGTGAMAAFAAAQIGPQGHLLALEPSPHRHGLAQAHYSHMPQIEFRCAGADSLASHRPESFDATYLCEVVHWLPAVGHTMKELFRLLVPHGRLGIQGSLFEFESTVPEQEPFKKYQPEFRGNEIYQNLQNSLNEAGFRTISYLVQKTTTLFPDAETLVAFVEASSFNNYLGHLPEPLRTIARSRIVFDYRKKLTPEGIPLHGYNIQVIAIKPPPGPEALFRWWDLPIRHFFHAPRAVWASVLIKPPRKPA